MITEALLNLLRWIVDHVLLPIIPDWEMHLPASVSDAIGVALGWNDVFPVSECLTVVGLLVSLVAAMQLVKWTTKLVDWVADVLP